MVNHSAPFAVRVALAIALAAGAAQAADPPEKADALGWFNRQVGGMLRGGGQVRTTDVSSYLRQLEQTPTRGAGAFSARKVQAQAPVPVPPTAEWVPRVQDALEALRSQAAAAPGLQPLEDAAFRAALISSRGGFALPGQVLQNLAAGTEPLRKLLVGFREGLHDASGAASLDRIHRGCQKLLGQIQNNHQLVQLARDLLDQTSRTMEKARAQTANALERAGEVQAVPLVAAFTEVQLRARSNLESARSYLVRAQASMKTAFQTARSALSYVERVKEKSFESPAATFTLEDRPEAIERLMAGFDRMRDTIARAQEGMQTAHGLLYVNQKALLELLYTLRTGDNLRVPGQPSLLHVARALTRSADVLTDGLRTAQVELARQKQWRASLEAYHTPLFELGPLPDWVFTRDTILVGPGGGREAAGPAPDIERVIASLAEPPSAPEPLQLPAASEVPLIDLESLPAERAGSGAAGPSSATGHAAGESGLEGSEAGAARGVPATAETDYKLPAWY